MPNASFLADIDDGSYQQPQLMDRIFAPSIARDLRQQYESRARNFESRLYYGVADREQQKAYFDDMSSFTYGAIKRVQNYHIRKKLNAARQATKDSSVLNSTPVKVAAAMAAMYSGTTFNFNLTNSTTLSARTDLRSQRGALGVNSPYLSGSIDVMAGAPETRNSSVPSLLVGLDERYKFSVFRDLPFLGAVSGVTYGSTTSTLTTSVSKRLVGNLTCVLDSARSMRHDLAQRHNAEETVRLLFGQEF